MVRRPPLVKNQTHPDQVRIWKSLIAYLDTCIKYLYFQYNVLGLHIRILSNNTFRALIKCSTNNLLCSQGCVGGVRESDEVLTGPRVCRDLSNHVGSPTERAADLFMT